MKTIFVLKAKDFWFIWQ